MMWNDHEQDWAPWIHACMVCDIITFTFQFWIKYPCKYGESFSVVQKDTHLNEAMAFHNCPQIGSVDE